ncbi:hypothetical protein [Bilophila wadsworthia]|uniref:hypothetical protein n=1 Tax=Bilophila wadsworthia TaxID=35833 RepID=UPI00352127DA
MTVFSPSMGVFDLPYMFTNYEDCYKLIDQNWDEINKRMIAESGNMAVGWLVQGFRVLSNSKRPINTIEDLKGLKNPRAQQPDHDRHLPRVGRRTRAHGVGTRRSTPSSRRSSTDRKTPTPCSLPTSSRKCRSTSPKSIIRCGSAPSS